MHLPSIVEYFGKNNKWDLHRGQFGDFCIVQFKCTEDAENILKKRYHRIQKYILSVQPYDLVMTAANRNATGGEQFPQLNQNVWHEIFSYLDVVDLCAVANTCVQFKKLGEHVFSSTFDKITWRAGNQTADDIFNTFGHLISSLDVDIVEPYNMHFDRIVSKCGKNLRSLSIWMNGEYCAPMNFNTLYGLKVLFSQLQQIHINCRRFFDYYTALELFASCAVVESLSINCTSPSDQICNNINVNFPQLKEIKLQLNAAINDTGLEMLLTCNPGVKKLYIDECSRLTVKAIEIIARCAPLLDEITLGTLKNYCPSDLRPFGTLYCLKNLQILLDPALPLMNVIYDAGIQIERLELWYVNMTEVLIEQLTSMKSIKELTICSCNVTDTHLKMIAENLPFLCELRLAHSLDVTIDGLANMLCSANNLTVLQLTNVKHIDEANHQHLQTFMKQTKASIELGNF